MKILCIGDSNTYGYDPRSYIDSRYPADVRWTDRLRGYEVINRGVNGITVPTNLLRYDSVIRMEEPDLIFVMLGTNDITGGAGAEKTAERMSDFIAHIKEFVIPILLIAPVPVQLGEWVQDEEYIEDSYELAAMYREVAEKLGCMFADAGEWDIELTFDGVHFSPEGHITFAQRMQEYLQRKHRRTI